MGAGFVEDAENETQSEYRSRGCAVGRMLAQLDPELKAEVEQVMYHRRDIAATGIHRALLKRTDDAPSPFTINRHRRRECTCDHQGGNA